MHSDEGVVNGGGGGSFKNSGHFLAGSMEEFMEGSEEGPPGAFGGTGLEGGSVATAVAGAAGEVGGTVMGADVGAAVIPAVGVDVGATVGADVGAEV